MVGPSLVQGAQVVPEQTGDIADRPCGKLDAVLSPQRLLDLLPLAVVEVALGADQDHHVVADGPAWEERLLQRPRPLRDDGVRRPMTPGGAGVDSLTGEEAPVGQRVAPAQRGLLHQHRLAAERAGARLIAHHHLNPGEALQPAAATVLQGGGALPQIPEGTEGGSTVFFPGTSLYSA